MVLLATLAHLARGLPIGAWSRTPISSFLSGIGVGLRLVSSAIVLLLILIFKGQLIHDPIKLCGHCIRIKLSGTITIPLGFILGNGTLGHSPLEYSADLHLG